MRRQIENDRILNTYFLSSVVGYSAKLTPSSIDFDRPSEYSVKNCDFGFARHLPSKQKEFVELGEIKFKNNI
jgi:hypothetical protein